MEIIKRNLFRKLRSDNFQTGEQQEPMSQFKYQKMLGLMKDIANMPAGEVHLSNPLLNHRLKKIQDRERRSENANIESIYLLRIIVSNVNSIMSYGIPLRGIIQLGQYIRTRGNKADYNKLDRWLKKLHISRLAQLQGCILIDFFGFESSELPFVKSKESKTEKITFKSMADGEAEAMLDLQFKQARMGVKLSGKAMRRNLRHSLRYMPYAPVETTSNVVINFMRGLQEIEE